MIKAMKKLTATVLCLATCATLFTGCGGKMLN